jgi:hypothetical protein
MRARILLVLAALFPWPALADSFNPGSSPTTALTIGSTAIGGTPAGVLYSNGSLLESYAATVGTDPNQPTSPGPLLAFASNNSLMLTGDGTYNTAPLSIYGSNTTGSGAHLLEIYTNVGGLKALGVYFDAGGNQYSRLSLDVSGHTVGTNPHQSILPPNSNVSSMIGCWADITGPCIVARENQGMPGEQVFQGITWDGRSTVAISAGFSEIIFGNQTVTSGQYFLGTTFFGQGNAAALLQAGGPDNVTPVAQTFAASGAPVPVTAQAISGAAGTELVYLYALASSAVLQSIQVGMTVTDTTNSVIPANTTVTATNISGQTVTLSANITGSGIQFNDTLVFSTPNTAGSALTIAGGRGTGTGAGGVLNLGYSPAGSAGSAQNAWVNLLMLSSNGLTLGGPDSAAPPTQTVNVQNVLTGTTNAAGANTIFNGSAGTGTGAGGNFQFWTSSAGTTGSSHNAQNLALTIDGAVPVTIGRSGIAPAKQQLVLSPDSGVGTNGFGEASGGYGLLVFLGVTPYINFTGGSTGQGIMMAAAASYGWSSTAAIDGAASDTNISRISAGVVGIGTFNGTYGGTAKLGNIIATVAAPTVSASQIGYGSTTAASSSCGTLASAAGCVVINVAGTAHYIPYY